MAAGEGAQEPRLRSVPDYVSSAGVEAIELCALAGLDLDLWQQLALTDMLGERDDGKWACYRFGLVVPRQNGKGSCLEARELAGLFLLGEKLIVHSAHEQATSSEHFRRVLTLIEGVPEFDRRILKAVRGKGSEGIELRDGQRIFFKTRTQDGGRGLTGDFIALDEAMKLREETMAALVPTMAARSKIGNPQLVYAGSAVDAERDEHGVVLARLREEALRGDSPRLGYHEYSCEGEDPSAVPEEIAGDIGAWAQANPGLGIRISEEYVSDERGALDARTFAVERLGIGDWPRTDGLEGVVIDPELWASRADEHSKAVDPVCFALDVAPDRSRGAIGVAGRRDDGRFHVEVVDHRHGTGWMAERAAELVENHSPAAVILDAGGPGASLLPDLEDLGVKLTLINAKEQAQACGALFDAVEQDTIRHLAEQSLASAIKGAVKRPLSDAWAWSRVNSSIDISPLVAVTLALWAVQTTPTYDGPLLEMIG